MPKQGQIIELEGTITAALPNTMFRVVIDKNQNNEEWKAKELLCTLSGRMRMYRIRVMPGDKVKVQVTPYDSKRGRIIFREK